MMSSSFPGRRCVYLAHPWALYLQNSVWTPVFGVTLCLLLMLTFAFLPLIACFVVAFGVSFVSRKWLCNRIQPVPANAAVVITGTSSGIGFDAACRLASIGFTVFATVRKQADADRLMLATRTNATLTHASIVPILLELTEHKQIERCVETVKRHINDKGLQLLGIVNNAGYGEGGVIELMAMESIRRQFEVNVFSSIAMTQAFLPLLRQAKFNGYTTRIVLVSSVVGNLSMATNGVYAASKHAIEAIGDAWRQELKKWRIDVVIVKPGFIETSFKDAFEKNLERNFNGKHKFNEATTQSSDLSAIRDYYENSCKRMFESYTNAPMGNVSITSDAIEAALLDSRPLPRMLAGFDAGVLPLALILLPSKVMDFAVGRHFR